MKRYGKLKIIVTDRLKSYRAAMTVIGNQAAQNVGRWENNRAKNSHLPFQRRERAMSRFRLERGQQKFIAAHSSVCNHFNQERHLISRGVFRENAKLPLSSGSNFLLHKSPHFIGKLRRVRVRLTGPLPLSGCEAPCENFILTQTNLGDSQCQRFHRPSCRIAAIRVGVH